MKQPENEISVCEGFNVSFCDLIEADRWIEIGGGRTARTAIRAGIRRLKKLTRELEQMEAEL